ncbi:immunity protein TriTu family protein [Cronobacter turicensis]
MLGEFERWVRKNTNFDIVHNKNEYSESIFIDFDNDKNICRLTL